MIWAALTLALGAVVAAMIFAWSNKPRVVQQRARKTVVVTLPSGAAYRGVLYDCDSQVLALRSAHLLTSDGVVPVDGEMLVERAGATIQIP